MPLSQSLGYRKVNGAICLTFIPNGTSSSTEDTPSYSSGGVYPSSLGKRPRYEHNVSASKSKGVVRKLFQKELTASDVGNLNRLVLPKKNVLKYFPDISENEVRKSRGVNDAEMDFYDKTMKLWKFRYCYWKSTGIFAFSRGWRQFVKENRLQPKDTIIFSLCQNAVSSYFLIDVCYFERLESDITNSKAPDVKDEVSEKQVQPVEAGRYSEATAVVDSVSPRKKGFRLFGVEINSNGR